jgi:outer membrane protein OmpA-like peptidoglycan-associated protein
MPMVFGALVGAVCVVATPALAQRDVAGAKDHPLAGRFSGSAIVLHEAKNFDRYVLPLGALTFRNDQYRWSASRNLEGRVTRITYVMPRDVAPVAAQRAYEELLTRNGFEVLFRGGGELGFLYTQWYDAQNPYPDGKRRFLLGGDNQRFLAARLARPEGDVYVAVYASTGNVIYQSQGTIQVDVIEVAPLAAGLVRAPVMASELDKAGRVAIYTLYFDTGRAELKPPSDTTISEIAALLKGNAALKLYVVGHTDNVGTLAANTDLSQRRAAAVVSALTTKFGIAASRLKAAGVGPLAPVAPNATDDGRAKNRRVELVAQ